MSQFQQLDQLMERQDGMLDVYKRQELADELRGVIFRVPGQTEPDGTPHYVTADEYLSGLSLIHI